eukprot:TRINITY_DN235_c0_g1_i36.p1 TRINITY_DN235_c0_g1~~TRINITY_DN235_c0_g1_i36.p1  ORF type:complete len:105 (+),score=9.50 TRINITY_DN235_c0_g1_i36:1002-1316(+)
MAPTRTCAHLRPSNEETHQRILHMDCSTNQSLIFPSPLKEGPGDPISGYLFNISLDMLNYMILQSFSESIWKREKKRNKKSSSSQFLSILILQLAVAETYCKHC